MTAAVTPDLVLGYLRELAVDLVVAAVAAPDGTVLAGPAALAAAAAAAIRRVREAQPDRAILLEVRDAGRLVVVAGDAAHVVAAVHTLHALPGLVRHDVLTAVRDLSGSGTPADSASPAPRAPSEADAAALLAAADAKAT